MKKSGTGFISTSTSNVFPIREREPLSTPRKPTDKGFPAVVPLDTSSTSARIKQIFDEADNNNEAIPVSSRSLTPTRPISTEIMRQSYRSDLPPAMEVIDAPFSNRPSEAPTAKSPIFPSRRSLKEAFKNLSPSVRRAIIELDIAKEKNDDFLAKYRELKSDRNIIPTLINGLSTLLNERVIDLPSQFHFKGANFVGSSWVILECTEDSLDTSFPMVQVVNDSKLNDDDQNPISVPLRIVFLSNLIQ